MMTIKELEEQNKRVDRHRGSCAEWLERHEQVCREAVGFGPAGVRLVAGHLFARAAAMNNLLMAWNHVKERSGRTAGPDGLTCEHFDEREKCEFLRSVLEAIHADKYRHGGTKPYKRPKRSGGFRWIHVPDLIDRVVQRAIVQAVQPLLDAMFDPRSFGYRRGVSRFNALAVAERYAAGGRTVWLAEDLKNAFDSVPVERSLRVFRKFLPCPRLAKLVERAVWRDGGVGLIQGGPLSPLLLNLYLHHVLDGPWRARGSLPPLLRYSDNVLAACASADEAARARQELERLLLPAGFMLKPPRDGDSTVRDLGRGMTVTWLGFDVALAEGRLVYSIPVASLNALFERLERDSPAPAADRVGQAGYSVMAWLREMGPAYRDVRRDACFDAIFAIGRDLGVDLTPSLQSFKEAWRKANRRWHAIRRDAMATE